jgi:hypothetical protein
VLIEWVPLAVLATAQGHALSADRAGSWLLDFGVHVLVSLPLLLVLCLGWLWRLFLWGWFLWRLSRLDLRLVPAHPDQVAGLKFVGYSVRAFSLFGFALGVIAAGRVAVRVVHTGVSPLAFAHVVIGLVVCVVHLCSGPLLVFTGKLLEAWRRGIFAYGALASDVGRQFEHKWLKRTEAIDAGALEVPDFSATTDLYQLVSNVYQVWLVPLDLKSLGLLVIATLLPFLPVVFTVVPLKVIFAELTHLLF